MKRFYDSLKCLYGPRTSRSTLILSADDSRLITDKKGISERWAEHYNSVLNRPSKISDEVIHRLPQVTINKKLDALSSVEEVTRAIKQLSVGKAPVADAIPAEVFKVSGTLLIRKLTDLFQFHWEKEKLLQEFKDATIVHLYEKKGNER